MDENWTNQLYFGENLQILRDQIPAESIDLIYLDENWTNQLYFGENLQILRDQIPAESIDPIYLDPPFNSNAGYNVLFKEKSGEKSAAQITAFEDTWHWSQESEVAFREIVTAGPRQLADLMNTLIAFLGRNDMMAYLVMMAIRTRGTPPGAEVQR